VLYPAAMKSLISPALAALAAAFALAVPMFAQTPAAAKNPVVVVKTSMGTFKAELYPEKAPGTVANFLKYADDKFYDGTVFHRVIPTFMIQGGGMDKDLAKKPTRAPIQNEAKNGLKNATGTLAMARTSDPHSATAQFFVNVTDNGFLDYPGQDGWGYCVFGKVTEGMDVVAKIKAVPTGAKGGMGDVPQQPVTIESIRRQ